ncbi:MAG TPA: ornithine cyclodeaminase family protein [Chthoniobacterales bacterium]|nr:ornithine cyclodeaminase family protein [Chthoniobacterales bacterium]
MQIEGPLLLSRSDVEEILSLAECIEAVENVFRWQGEGRIPAPGILGVNTPRGGLHVKAACLPGDPGYIVAKLNTNFPDNGAAFGLPTIQGVIVVFAANNGAVVAVLDSMEITIKRTAAATAVAAEYLARKNSRVATICGCGRQAAAQLRALCTVLPLERIFAFDLSKDVARNFAATLSTECRIDPVRDLSEAICQSDVVVTCTPSRRFFVRQEAVKAGTFIAAVGADAEEKQEIDPALMASAKVVADSVDQACTIGDTHHAIAAGLMERGNIYAELSEIAAGRKPGRTHADEIIVFDSTGVAIEDAIAAITVYEKAINGAMGNRFSFAA